MLAIVFMAFMACENAQVRKKLVGSWSYDLEATRLEMMRQEATPSQINYMESILTTLDAAKLLFESDGSMLLLLDDIEQSGTWILQKKGKELVMNLTGSDQVSTIKYISSDTLVLDPQRVDQISFPRVLISTD